MANRFELIPASEFVKMKFPRKAIVRPSVKPETVRVRGEALSQPIYWTGWQWAVTSYGIECRDGTYAIARKRIWENEAVWPWWKHMAGKDWVDLDDFNSAMAFARWKFRELFRIKINLC